MHAYIHTHTHTYVYSYIHTHILLECAILQEDRERLIAAVAKTDNWPINKDVLIKEHYKALAKFTKKMDKITEINT